MIEWVFMDVGNVLLNDEPALGVVYYELFKTIMKKGVFSGSFRDLLHEREAIIGENNTSAYSTLAKRYLDKRERKFAVADYRSILFPKWADYSPPIPGMLDATRKLSGRFKLGIIANQPTIVISALEKFGFLPCFSVLGISDMIGFYKPNEEIFEWALGQAGCAPEKAVMIGDRPDNDIVPAKKLGMKTVLVRIPHEAKNYEPIAEIQKLYRESLLTADMTDIEPGSENERPDAFATDAGELYECVRRLAE